MSTQGEPVAYWNGRGAIIPAEDVSYLPNWSDYYPIPLYTSAPTIPEGYVLVPVEPTEEMILAGDAFMECASSLGEAWEAMIAAARRKA